MDKWTAIVIIVLAALAFFAAGFWFGFIDWVLAVIVGAVVVLAVGGSLVLRHS